MKRGGFKPKVPARPDRPDRSAEFASFQMPKPRAATIRIIDGKARMVVPVPKHPPVRDEAYRRLVAAMPCDHCQRPPPSQCAHADEGKGMGMKSDDDGCFPLCADSPGRVGCHTLIGSRGMFAKEQRRYLEQKYAQQTRDKLKETA